MFTCVGFLIVFSCSQPQAAIPPNHVTDVACASFAPFRWSKRDTLESIKQAKAHNAAGVALGCWGKK
jgi:hypothetical protein